MTISTLQFFRQGVNSMLDQQARLLETQQQLSTGKRINHPSDDPTGAVSVLDLSQALTLTDQYQRNIDQAKIRLDTEETVLSSTTDLMQRARELTVQGLNATVGGSQRAAIAQEIRQLQGEMLSLANRKDGNGDYLFAGLKADVTPFVNNGAAGFTYQGDQGQRRVQIATDRQVADGDSGLAVFMKVPSVGGGYEDVFSTLDKLATGLEANAPDPSSLDQIDNALGHLLAVRSGVGARLNALDNQASTHDSIALNLKSTLSGIGDLDYAEAAARLSQQSVALQAAQQAFARVQGLTLFNYL
jgi:flagellar hook-associated protein 3 FlgL